MEELARGVCGAQLEELRELKLQLREAARERARGRERCGAGPLSHPAWL